MIEKIVLLNFQQLPIWIGFIVVLASLENVFQLTVKFSPEDIEKETKKLGVKQIDLSKSILFNGLKSLNIVFPDIYLITMNILSKVKTRRKFLTCNCIWVLHKILLYRNKLYVQKRPHIGYDHDHNTERFAIK